MADIDKDALDADGLEAAEIMLCCGLSGCRRREYPHHTCFKHDGGRASDAIIAYLTAMEAKRKPAEEVAREVVDWYIKHLGAEAIWGSKSLTERIAAAIKADREGR